MTKQEFIQQYQISKRAETRRLLILAAITVVILTPAFILAPRAIYYINQSDPSHWVSSVKGNLVWGIWGCFLLMFAFASRRLSQPYGAACPVCGEKLYRTSAYLALITGNCGFCSEKVFDDRDPCPANILKILRPYE